MFKQVDYVMVVVSDMSRSVKFYRDQLGLALKFESPGWSEFQTGATTLALHGGGKPQEKKGGNPGEQYAGTCSLGFSVENLDQKFGDLKARGVIFVKPPTEQKEEGIKLAVAIDPDGLPVAFAETLR